MVRSDARSVPASGSEYPIEKWISPAAIFGSKNDFWAAVPNRMIVGPTVLMVRNGTGTRAAAASSVKMSWSSMVPPRPPYSARPAQRQPPVPAELPDDRAVGLPVPQVVAAAGQGGPDLRRHQPAEVSAQLPPQPFLLRGVGDPHEGP